MFYAKTKPEKESIRQHTDNVLKNYELLKEVYSHKIDNLCDMNCERLWHLLRIACEYHDYGKANLAFQNKLKKILGETVEKEADYEEIPHNYLSPAFLPMDKLSEDEQILLSQVIAYHHEREKEPINGEIEYIVKNDLANNLKAITSEMGIEVNKLRSKYSSDIAKKRRITNKSSSYKDYIIMKGLLHRMDHSASAHIVIEEKVDKSVAQCTKEFFDMESERKKKYELREPQLFAMENRDENLLLIASTGIGKTETALFWINDDKAFFTLPLRVSINALYSRVQKDIGFNSIGLIHSTSKEYLVEQGFEDYAEINEQSKLLSKKLNFSTIDQIFKFPFKFKGYEKIYATLAYSKVVIDEIQAYSPEMTAVILKGLEMIHEIGGKFMVMTATFPRIYRDYLNKKGIMLKEAEFILDKKRHKIKLNDKSICDDVDNIIEKAKEKKVLVIVNTVKRSLEIYDLIKKAGYDDVKLLHSMFIQEDRARLEGEIKEFADKGTKGIWVTTQIVEASLDIDFDYLFTEMSTLDSLFQRFGRCYRKREYKGEVPNVYIYTKEITGVGTIYDEDILNKSINYINVYDETMIEERVKAQLVDKLYSEEELDGTEFYNKFKNAIGCLENIIDYDVTNNEAQKLLRDIETIRAIPEEIYIENIELFEKYRYAIEKKEREKLLMSINKFIVNIPEYKLKISKANIEDIDIEHLKGLKRLKTKYSSTIGVTMENLDNIF